MVRIMKMVCVHREQDIEKKLNKMVETLSSEPDAVRRLSLKTIEKKKQRTKASVATTFEDTFLS